MFFSAGSLQPWGSALTGRPGWNMLQSILQGDLHHRHHNRHHLRHQNHHHHRHHKIFIPDESVRRFWLHSHYNNYNHNHHHHHHHHHDFLIPDQSARWLWLHNGGSSWNCSALDMRRLLPFTILKWNTNTNMRSLHPCTICLFWYTTTIVRPVKITPKSEGENCDKIAQMVKI